MTMRWFKKTAAPPPQPDARSIKVALRLEGLAERFEIINEKLEEELRRREEGGDELAKEAGPDSPAA